MKNLLATLIIIMMTFVSATAQVSFGIEAGVSPAFNPNTNAIFANRENPIDEFKFNLKGVNSTIFFGANIQQDLSEMFFIKAQALYNQRETKYESTYTFEQRGRSAQSTELSETVRQLDIPVSLGVRLGMIDITSGFVTHIMLSTKNDLSKMENILSNPRKVDFGWQSGVGLNIANIRFGLTYQMDFANYGSHLSLSNKSLVLQNSPTRILASIGYQF